MNAKLVKQFTEKAQAVSAEVFPVKDLAQANQKVMELIEGINVTRVGCVADKVTKDIISHLEDKGIEVVKQASPKQAAEIEVGIISVEAGIAETGTIAHDATNLFARYLSMLSQVNIAILNSSNITGSMIEAYRRLEIKGTTPSYAAFITGPSRTADIERVLTIGVHGPGRLCIILVDEEGC